VATIQELAVWLAQFLRDMQLIIFGLLIVWGTIFFSQKLVTPELFKRWKNGERHSV
jgi:branched-chain amino acid transport system permease protein